MGRVLKQIDVQQKLQKHKKQHLRHLGVKTGIVVFLCGGLLFGSIQMMNSAQPVTPTCLGISQPECIKDMPKPICRPYQARFPCPLDIMKKKCLYIEGEEL